MIKRAIFAASATALLAAPAWAATTYVILPTPGSMAPATVYVDESGGRGDRVFICDSLSQLYSGTCRLRGKARRLSHADTPQQPCTRPTYSA